MVDITAKKVGIVACSGEELAEGTVTRLAALRVLEQKRPNDTVTICLPLFLAGGEGDRAFARFYPTIAIDGCSQRCAARATEKYSGKPAAGLVVSELIEENGMEKPEGRRRLNAAGLQAVELCAEKTATLVDDLLKARGAHTTIGLTLQSDEPEDQAFEEDEPKVASCSCGSGIPVLKVKINAENVELVALPLIFDQFLESGLEPAAGTVSADVRQKLMEAAKVYNSIPPELENAYAETIAAEYIAYCRVKEAEGEPDRHV